MLEAQSPKMFTQLVENPSKIPKPDPLRPYLTPAVKKNFLLDKTGLDPIPEKPTVQDHTVKTRSTLSKTAPSFNSVTSRKAAKTQAFLMDTSIVLDFITETEKETYGLQKTISIRPSKKLKKQFFYNTIYDIRQDQEPLEAKIDIMERVYKEKVEDMLWNTPPQAMMKNVLESYARVQPKGIISEYLNQIEQKNEVRKIQRANLRASFTSNLHHKGVIKAKTVDNFFKQDRYEEREEIHRIIQAPKRYKEIMENTAEQDVEHNINKYAMTLSNCNALLQSTQEVGVLPSIEEFLDDTPEKAKPYKGKATEGKWSEESTNKKTGDSSIPQVSTMDHIESKDESTKKVHFVDLSGQINSDRSTFNPKNSRVDRNSVTFYANKTKAGAMIRKRPNTSATTLSKAQKIIARELLIRTPPANGLLVLDGKKALPENLANPYKLMVPRTSASSVPKEPRERVQISTRVRYEDVHSTPQTPGNWVLQGKMVAKVEEQVVEEEAKDAVFERKGKIPKTKTTPRVQNLISLTSRPKSENDISKRGPRKIKKEPAVVEESPKDLLNAWASEEFIIPSFRIKRLDPPFEQQLVQEGH